MDIADITIIAIVALAIIVIPARGLFADREEREDDLRAED